VTRSRSAANLSPRIRASQATHILRTPAAPAGASRRAA
jgi:hypothetical protein